MSKKKLFQKERRNRNETKTITEVKSERLTDTDTVENM